MPDTTKRPGRPRIGPSVTVCVPDDTLEVITEHARTEGLTVSEAIRSAVVKGARAMAVAAR